MESLLSLKLRNEINANDAETEKRELLDSLPVRITVQTNKNCNLKCSFCGFASFEKLHKENELTPEILLIIANEIFPTAREVVPSTLGEPLIYRHLDKLISLVNENQCSIALYTNGMLLNDNMIYKLTPFLSELKLSFDGITKKTYETLRKGSNYERVLKNISRFLEIRKNFHYIRPPIVTWQFTLMKSNIPEFTGAIKKAMDLGFDRVAASHVYVFRDSNKSESLVNDQETSDNYMSEAIKLSENNLIELFLPKMFNSENETPQNFFAKSTCAYLYKESWINPNGDIHPCFIPDSPVMGNIKKDKFNDIWNGKKYQQMRRTVNSETPAYWRCKNCPIRIQFDNTYMKEYNYDAFDLSKGSLNKSKI